MKNVVIVSGVRTAIGSYGKSLKAVAPSDLAALVIKESISRAGIDGGELDQVIMGNVIQSIGDASNPARTAALKAGVPVEVPAYTLNRLCGSGLQAINSAYEAIVSGAADAVLAAGMESMSNAPYLLEQARWGYRMGDAKSRDGVIAALTDSNYLVHMGVTAENLAEKYDISREEQDEFALLSQQRAVAAIESGEFTEQIVPVEIPARKGETIRFDTDEHPRKEASLEGLAKLKTVFKKDGTVTAGNASGINDAAAAMILMTEERAKELGLKPLASIKGYATAGVDPLYMGFGPVPATQKVLARTGLTLKDIDLIELNEAFAAQYLACEKALKLDRDKVNIQGGAIAMGHPLGATGVILLIKLIYQMIEKESKYGLATACIGGGQGIATLIER
ncbi:thiolase family protein [Metallumcola ferriviriculae]|uniref:Acetyl-CoA acetyltransferase n=1 Tax=Metallumcola ferriviriculae TaxID=3039180 RepID=A0AAU0URK9_9FIRM|nr:thiolase family protein [Desulfitibacteraceae bacterium MK1]